MAYDNEQFYTIDSLFMIFANYSGLEIKYLLGLLNSKLLNRQYQKINPEQGRVFAQVKIDYVNEIPIIISQNQLPIINLVEKILSLKSENPQADTQVFEDEIDELVFELYGLSAEERAVVLGG